MKATGIIRRIDNLGRVVIPKEIRDSLRLNEGNNLEIYVEDNKIILGKYDTLKKLEDFAQVFTDVIYSSLKNNIIITDSEKIIAFSGINGKTNVGKLMGTDLEAFFLRHDNLLVKDKEHLQLTEDLAVEASYIVNTIMISGDAAGLVVIFSTDSVMTEDDKLITEITTRFLEKYLEV